MWLCRNECFGTAARIYCFAISKRFEIPAAFIPGPPDVLQRKNEYSFIPAQPLRFFPSLFPPERVVAFKSFFAQSVTVRLPEVVI